MFVAISLASYFFSGCSSSIYYPCQDTTTYIESEGHEGDHMRFPWLTRHATWHVCVLRPSTYIMKEKIERGFPKSSRDWEFHTFIKHHHVQLHILETPLWTLEGDLFHTTLLSLLLYVLNY